MTELSVRLGIEGARFLAFCPSLGLVSEHATREGALERLEIAASLYLDEPAPKLRLEGPVLAGP